MRTPSVGECGACTRLSTTRRVQSLGSARFASAAFSEENSYRMACLAQPAIETSLRAPTEPASGLTRGSRERAYQALISASFSSALIRSYHVAQIPRSMAVSSSPRLRMAQCPRDIIAPRPSDDIPFAFEQRRPDQTIYSVPKVDSHTVGRRGEHGPQQLRGDGICGQGGTHPRGVRALVAG